jgi:hypothetical protein
VLFEEFLLPPPPPPPLLLLLLRLLLLTIRAVARQVTATRCLHRRNDSQNYLRKLYSEYACKHNVIEKSLLLL